MKPMKNEDIKNFQSNGKNLCMHAVTTMKTMSHHLLSNQQRTKITSSHYYSWTHLTDLFQFNEFNNNRPYMKLQ